MSNLRLNFTQGAPTALQMRVVGIQGPPGPQATITVSTTPPASPSIGDLWVDTN